MTVENSNNRDRLTADGVEVDFDFTTKIFNDTELLVYIIDNNGAAVLKTITADYTVSISTVTEGGTVTFLVAPTDTYEVLMLRSVPNTQSADIPVNGGFSEVVIENALDRLAIQIQQINDLLTKVPQLSTTSAIAGITVPDPESEKLIRWKDDLSGFENIILGDADVADLPNIASGDALKHIRVNSAETEYELADVDSTKIEDADANTGWEAERTSDDNILYGKTAGVDRLIVDATGHITMPSQPAFAAEASGVQTNIAVGGDVTIIFQTEIFDIGSNFASNTFTAPVDGKYQLNAAVKLDGYDSASTALGLSIVTSNKTWTTNVRPDLLLSGDGGLYVVLPPVVADMDAGDTAFVKVNITGGAAQADVANQGTFFTGAKLT
jgi:hypothetical protein